MQCPKCKRENAPTNRFCIYCGSILQAPELKDLPEPEPEQSDFSPGQLLVLQREVRRLSELVTLMNNRLANLERRQGMPAFPPETITAAPVPEETPVAEAVPTVERWEGLVTEPLGPPPEPRPPTPIEREWEQILGGNWLARIGVLALIIGAGFFLKFAFDQNWLGPTGRIILGVVAGLVMLGGGHYWQKKYPIFAQAISGGGIALLYLCTFAAHVMFDLIGFYPAIVLLLVISIISVILALRYNSMALAIIGIIGAFIAPFILATTTVTTGDPSSVQALWLLVYTMVIDIGVLWLSTFRNWRWFTLLALIGSLLVFGVWYDQFGGDFSLWTSMVCLTVIFLIFIGTTMLYHFIWRKVAQAFDYILMVINAAAYFGISYGLLWDDLRAWVGGFSFLLALFYGGLAYLAHRRGVQNIRLALFALGIALIFLTIAIPVQLEDMTWTAIAWAAQGTVLIWLSFRLRMFLLRSFSYIIFFAIAIYLLVFNFIMDQSDYTPVLNERFLVFLVSIAAMYLVSYILWREKKLLQAPEQTAWSIYPVFLIAANFFTIWLLSTEVWSYFANRLADLTTSEFVGSVGDGLRSARNLSLTALWAFYAMILLVVGIIRRSRFIRISGLGLLAIPIFKVFLYDVFALEQIYRIIAFVGLGVLLVVSGYLYQRYREAIRGFVTEK